MQVELSLDESCLSSCEFLTIETKTNFAYYCFKEIAYNKKIRVRACSHKPGTVDYPGVMIAPGQALPRVHMMVCCPGATLPRGKLIVI